eukprot:scaffold32196_cov39-Isochrysis_galbana.AAC.1
MPPQPQLPPVPPRSMLPHPAAAAPNSTAAPTRRRLPRPRCLTPSCTLRVVQPQGWASVMGWRGAVGACCHGALSRRSGERQSRLAPS